MNDELDKIIFAVRSYCFDMKYAQDEGPEDLVGWLWVICNAAERCAQTEAVHERLRQAAKALVGYLSEDGQLVDRELVDLVAAVKELTEW